jgi:hypothetical protein
LEERTKELDDLYSEANENDKGIEETKTEVFLLKEKLEFKEKHEATLEVSGIYILNLF